MYNKKELPSRQSSFNSAVAWLPSLVSRPHSPRVSWMGSGHETMVALQKWLATPIQKSIIVSCVFVCMHAPEDLYDKIS